MFLRQLTLAFLAINTFYGTNSIVKCMTVEEKRDLRDQVKEMFRHGYDSYMKYAYPADELMPLSCKGRVRGVDPSRGDIDDSLGMFSLTLIDTLDTLAVLGEVEEFEKAVQLVISEVSFDNDVVISVFETNIRVLGGLLGGHMAAVTLKNTGQGMQWYTGELLDMAKDLGYRLLPAFNTTTGIPYPRVNLKYGIHHPESRTGKESDTCTACGGTMIMEFGALTRLSGEPIFEAKARKAMEALWTFRSRHSDLVGTVINIHNGDWVRRDSGIGAGVDSYYEYCLKAYILLGDETYLQRFNTHYKSIMRYINQGSMFLNVQMNQPDRMAHSYMDALLAFWPGLQVLKGDITKAIETHDMLYDVAKKHVFLPEAFTTDFEVHWGQHPLRPEFVESTYFLYEATKDPYYLEAGKYILEKINLHARVPCGFAAMRDVRTLSHEDRMDSFVLAETFKYLYLLFAEKEDLVFDMHQFIFTTEAHILPISLSTNNSTLNATDTPFETDHAHDYVCPNTLHENGEARKFAQEIREKSRSNRKQGSCNKKPASTAEESPSEADKLVTSSPVKLRAEEFTPGNPEHVKILQSMGIKVVQTEDGRIQLMHTAASAETKQDAASGIKFMQEMIELAKKRGEPENVETNPRVVQIISPPYYGSVSLNAGPAQFGLDLSKGDFGVGAEVVLGDPYKGCSSMADAEAVKHRIVVMERGECMFIDKVRHAQKAGAVGVIVIDNNAGSSSDSQPIFAMSGDGTSSDVQIPAVFLFSNEGNILKKAMEEIEASKGDRLRVRIAAKASDPSKLKATEQEDGIPKIHTRITIEGDQLYSQVVKSCSSTKQSDDPKDKQLMQICAKHKECEQFTCSPHAILRGIAVKCILWRKQKTGLFGTETKDVLNIYSVLKKNLKFGGEIIISDDEEAGMLKFIHEKNGEIVVFTISQPTSNENADVEKKTTVSKEDEGCPAEKKKEEDGTKGHEKSYTKAFYDPGRKIMYVQTIECNDDVCKVQTKSRQMGDAQAKAKEALLVYDDILPLDKVEKDSMEIYKIIQAKTETMVDNNNNDDGVVKNGGEEAADVKEGDHAVEKNEGAKEDQSELVKSHVEEKDKNEPNVREERTSDQKESNDNK